MTKRLLFVAGVLGIVAFADAQTNAPRSGWTGLASTISQEADVTRLRGGVKLTVNGVTITAEEADISRTAGVADLRGNVRLFLPETAR